MQAQGRCLSSAPYARGLLGDLNHLFLSEAKFHRRKKNYILSCIQWFLLPLFFLSEKEMIGNKSEAWNYIKPWQFVSCYVSDVFVSGMNSQHNGSSSAPQPCPH